MNTNWIRIGAVVIAGGLGLVFGIWHIRRRERERQRSLIMKRLQEDCRPVRLGQFAA